MSAAASQNWSSTNGDSPDSSPAILVVDDNSAKRLSIGAVLAPLAHTTIEAESGEAALREVTKRKFAVILMDVQMPDMNGYETATLIRTRNGLEQTPIIFITSYAKDEAQIPLAYASGAVDFIFAPIVPEILRAKVAFFVDLYAKSCELERLNNDYREREEHIRAVLGSVADGIVTINDADEIESLNRAASGYFGYEEDEAVGLPFSMIVAPHGSVELMGHRKDGSTFPIEIDLTDLQLGARRIRIGTLRDISERRLAEEEHERLETRQRQTQKMEAIGSLAAGIAHDFNNILLVVRGHSALLLDVLTEEAQREPVRTIESAASRATELTRQLLAFSRQQVLNPEPTNLNDVVAETMAMLAQLLGEDIEVVREPDPKLAQVVVDRNQLAQVILNLSINARDAMRGGGELTVKTANIELDDAYAAEHDDVVAGSHVLLQVTDSGTGMDESTIARIFDPFFTTKEEGTGLGLATVWGIVKQSGGHIWLYSELGLGTTFKLYFPVATDPVELARIPPAAEITSLEGTETVLLVEDADQVRVLVGRILRSYGYTVIEAPTPTEALEIAEAEDSIDLLLTDVVMPGMNGRELAEALSKRRPRLRVLFTSGFPADGPIREAIATGRAAFIEKPYRPKELALKLREILEPGLVSDTSP